MENQHEEEPQKIDQINPRILLQMDETNKKVFLFMGWYKEEPTN